MKLLDSILQDTVWTDESIICQSEEQAKLFHTFLREAILDRHIYNARVAGVAVKSTISKHSVAKTYIAKHQDVGESYAELTTQLTDKLFFITDNEVADIDLTKGVNKASECKFIHGGKPLSCLYVNDLLCRAIKDNVRLSLFITYNSGYKSMADNSVAIMSQHSSKYFPCNTDYSLAQYVRVLPPRPGCVINVRFYNGMTPDIFKLVLSNWNVVLDSGKLVKEDREWLEKYM